MAKEQGRARQGRWWHPHSIWRSIRLRPRLIMAVLASLLAFFVLPQNLSGSVREVVIWIVGGLVYLGSAGHTMWKSPSETIASRAANNDDSRMVIIVLILLAIASSFVSIAGLMTEAKQATSSTKALYLFLAALTVIVSWFVMQVAFTMHYAHEFYRPDDRAGEQSGGLEFPGEPKPDYWDFLYFATSIGATSQTSDTSIRTRPVRRLATVHAVVSFFFNSAVLAITINLAASLI